MPKSRIDEVLSIVSLSNESRRPVKGFSLGMKQRLGIAASLLANPDLLILDEPTNGLDPSGIHEIRELIKSLPEQYGITVLVSSHLLGEMEQMAHTVGIIREGKMVFQDTIHNLRVQSAHDIELVVSEPDAALWIARDLGSRGLLQDSKLTFPGMDDQQIAHLVKRLVENGHDIYRVEMKKKSLEDIFMQVIGEGAPS
ncbi:putative ABC transporter ATP-binding protein YxlF [compost metagenome]